MNNPFIDPQLQNQRKNMQSEQKSSAPLLQNSVINFAHTDVPIQLTYVSDSSDSEGLTEEERMYSIQ